MQNVLTDLLKFKMWQLEGKEQNQSNFSKPMKIPGIHALPFLNRQKSWNLSEQLSDDW